MPQEIPRKSKSQNVELDPNLNKRNEALTTILDPIVSGAIPPRSQYMQSVKNTLKDPNSNPGGANEILNAIQVALACEDLYERMTAPPPDPTVGTVEQELKCLNEKLGKCLRVFHVYQQMFEAHLRAFGTLNALYRMGIQVKSEHFKLDDINVGLDNDAIQNPQRIFDHQTTWKFFESELVTELKCTKEEGAPNG